MEPRQRLHYAYQQAAILSYAPYSTSALPEERQLVADLQALARLYMEIVSDPLEATVDRLVEAVVETARVETIEARDFESWQPRKVRDSSGSNSQERRYSPASRKVGDAGERAVMRYERERLVKLGRQDLADRVRWHAQEREFVGWDITSLDDDGDECFIEVSLPSESPLLALLSQATSGKQLATRDGEIDTSSTSSVMRSPRCHALNVCGIRHLALTIGSYPAFRLFMS